MKIGYARVSTVEQNLDLQKDALEKAGCKKIFVDEVSGTVANREGLEKAKEILREGDVLVVWRLDRLGRSIRDLIDWVTTLEEEGIGFKSLQESIDTTTSSGKLVFHIFAALAEFERNLIRERTNAGLAAARARGRLGGRKKSLNAKGRKQAVEMYERKNQTVRQICEMMNITKPTLYAYIREEQASKKAKA
jgi:DNA invertase Pin-like site-specific DNA recombinase